MTIEADGDFTYVTGPADGCTDTSDFFDYTVEDPAPPEPHRHRPGDDRDRRLRLVRQQQRRPATPAPRSAPFDTLAQAETASGANHTVFVFDGDNTATGYGGTATR